MTRGMVARVACSSMKYQKCYLGIFLPDELIYKSISFAAYILLDFVLQINFRNMWVFSTHNVTLNQGNEKH